MHFLSHKTHCVSRKLSLKLTLHLNTSIRRQLTLQKYFVNYRVHHITCGLLVMLEIWPVIKFEGCEMCYCGCFEYYNYSVVLCGVWCGVVWETQTFVKQSSVCRANLHIEHAGSCRTLVPAVEPQMESAGSFRTLVPVIVSDRACTYLH
jgi:hypothetical protein